MASGLVASRMILPLRLPSERTTASVAFHGVASRTKSLAAAASAGDIALALAPIGFSTACTFSALGLRTPKRTVWPLRAQLVPKAAPTLPAPMMAISMACSAPSPAPLRLHHHLACLGDRAVQILGGVAEDHLIVRAARGNHREAVLLR